MNKLGVLSVLAVVYSATSVYAGLNKNDLEKAIRSLDVETVRQIVATEKFTQKESDRYLDLANQMINDRKFSIRGALLGRDVITSCDKSKVDMAKLETRIGLLIANSSGFALWMDSVNRVLDFPVHSNRYKGLLVAGVLAGAALVIKSFYDFEQYLKTELRPKYDDAITIKQIIYTARVEGL